MRAALLPLLLLLLLSLGLSHHCTSAAPVEVTCLYDQQTKQFSGKVGKATAAEGAVAFAVWDDQIGDGGSGLGQLWVTLAAGSTNRESQVSSVEWTCAGFAEGFVTAQRINELWRSFLESDSGLGNATILAEIRTFTKETFAWSVQQAQQWSKNSEYWAHVQDILDQAHGIMLGYNAAPAKSDAPQTLTDADIFLLNMMGDLDDLIPAFRRRLHERRFGPGNAPAVDVSDSRVREVIINSHCSSMVKPSADGKDLFAAHEMWASYFQMLNIFKHYEFGPVPIHFSSYPGFVSSEDDFYQIDGGHNMVVMETTNGIFNLSLYDRLTPKSLMSWIRVMVSNRMATSGEAWVNTMSRYNSGTYNNQWIIVDMKKFDPAKVTLGSNGHYQLAPGTLWIGSQLPGFWEQADVTHVVNSQGYWPSYNIPYFKTVFDLAGYPAVVKEQGDMWTYDNCPRAKIFRRQAWRVSDIPNLMDFMRYNNWLHDPDALECPLNQIASRLDLAPKNYSTLKPYCAPAAFGAINAKLTSFKLQKDFQAWIIAGPTHEFLPPFAWTKEVEAQFPSTKHYGQPVLFNSFWVNTSPQSPTS